MKNAVKHFKKICTHKYWVAKYCFKMGLYHQGIMHDMSKFSLVEFGESLKYYQGTSSPIDACKKVNGYSLAWQHHKGRNPHHYEYWTDNYDKGTIAIKMPFKYACEMLADYIAAGKAYMGEGFSWSAELEWWVNKIATNPKMHPDTKEFINFCLTNLANGNISEKHLFNKHFLKGVYETTKGKELNNE